MTQNTELIQKREELKRQLDAGEYKTLIDLILDGTGYLIQKLSRNPKPPSFWYNALVLCLATLLIPFLLTTLLLDDLETISRSSGSEDSPVIILLVILVYAIMVAAKIDIGIIFTTLRDSLLEAIESTTNLVELQRWLVKASNVKKPLLFSLVFGVLIGLYSTIVDSKIQGGFVGFGVVVFNIIIDFWFGLFIYYLYLILMFSIGISRYQLKLFATDPSSSEVIDHLSGMLSNSVYIIAGAVAIATFILAFFGLLPLEFIIIAILVGWGPLIIFFIVNQYALSKIITRAKWKELNEIQAKIEKLKVEENIADKGTMETIKRLIDYHNQVKGTPNSALNIRAGLNFLNSLLLPLVAFVLANIDKLLQFF